ncbi:MAG: hypothetical protein JWM11_7906 [Planctomycetaceae bacterium]|nr:hypothetical protein [Planctomycetaceae bacterium]
MNKKSVILFSSGAIQKQVVGALHFEWVSATNLTNPVDQPQLPNIAHRPVQYQWVVPMSLPQEKRDHIALQIGDALARNQTTGEVEGFDWQED